MDTRHASGCTASCGAGADSGLYLCRAHTDVLAAILAGVPDLVTELDVTVTRQNRTTSERHGARSSTRPLPWNEHAAAVAADLATVVNRATLTVAGSEQDERDRLTEVAAYDTANLARWLRRNLALVRRSPDAGIVLAEVDDAVRLARRAVDKPPESVFAGPCHVTVADGHTVCRGDVYGVPGGRYAVCGQCRARFDAAERREWMLAQIENEAAHSGLLASLVTGLGRPVGSSTIRRWAAAGRLTVISVDRNGRKLYRIGAVLELLHPERVSVPA